MATEAWQSLTENIKPKAVFRLCLIQIEAIFTFGVLGGYFGALGPSWSHLGLIWSLSWAILGRLGAMLGPCWATSALSVRLLGPFAAISEPRSKERATKVLCRACTLCSYKLARRRTISSANRRWTCLAFGP